MGLPSRHREIRRPLARFAIAGAKSKTLREALVLLAPELRDSRQHTPSLRRLFLLPRRSALPVRGYAGSEGFAIGFESTTCFNQIHKPRPVIYEPQAQESLIQSELSQILATWPHRHKQPRHGQYDGVAGAMLEHVSQILARFKDDSFAEEKEWRVWTSAPIGPPYAEPSPAARMNRSRLVPYVPLKFDTSVAHPIKSIVIGPSSDPRSSRRAVSVLLGSLGLQEAIEIYESAIPLRTNHNANLNQLVKNLDDNVDALNAGVVAALAATSNRSPVDRRRFVLAATVDRHT